MAKQKEEVFVALDIGTSKVCAMAGLKIPGKPLEIIGVGNASSKGIKKGIVCDIESTSEAIIAAVEECEEMADIEVNSVFVNVSGNHVKGFNNAGTAPIVNEHYEITKEDADKAISAAKAISIPMDKHVMHVISQEFTIDGQTGVREPVGMCGVKLDVGVHIVTASIAAMQNIIKCLDRANFEYEALVMGALASSYSVLTEEERDMGTVLIDIGAGTSEIAVYVDGSIKFSDVFPGGGNQITNDIAVALRVPPNKAEEIKKRHGGALRTNLPASEEFLVPGVLGRASRNMASRDLASIIEARAEETFYFIKQKIETSGLNEKIGSGVVLTGGSACLKDMDELASRVFNVPVRIGNPRGIGGIDYILESPSFATCVGLLMYGEESRRTRREDNKAKGKVFNLFFSGIKKFLHK